jgi:hypothetical protein
MDTEAEQEQEEVAVAEEEENQGQVGATLFDSLYAAADDTEEDTIGGEAITASLSGEPQPEHPAVAEPEPEPKKKVKRIHKKEVVDPDLPVRDASQEAFTPEPVEDDTDFLLPEEKDQLNVVRHIAKKNNTDQDKQLLDYFRKQKEYIEKRMSDNPDVNLSEDHDFEQFVARNRPSLDMTEVRSAEREMLLDEAEERALKRLRPELSRHQQETSRLKHKPQVEALKHEATNKAIALVPENLVKDLSTRSPEEVAKDNPYEYNIVNTAVTNAQRFAETFLDISKGQVDYNPSNPEHDQLRDWLVKEQDAYIGSGDTKDSNGRPFMRRERYQRLPAPERQKYWTWSDEQCVDIMYSRAKQTMDQELEQHNNAMQAYLNRQGGQPAPSAPAPSPQPAQPAPSRPTPRAGGTPQGNQPSSAPTPLSLLGM